MGFKSVTTLRYLTFLRNLLPIPTAGSGGEEDKELPKVRWMEMSGWVDDKWDWSQVGERAVEEENAEMEKERERDIAQHNA